MDRDTDRQRSLTRRTLVLGGLQVGLFGVLGARLYDLQVNQAERYARLADDNRINVQLIAPSRGRIVDRFGQDLAVNDQDFRLLMVAEQAGDVEAVLDRLSAVLPLDDDEVERVLRDVSSRRSFVPVTVRENLSYRQVAEIEVNAPDLPGLSIDVGELRRYPHARLTTHVVGYVGAVSEEELTGDPVLALPGFRIGKSGVEREHDLTLRGQAGARQVEVNAIGRIIRELSREEGQPGEDVQLTLDLGLQQYVQERLSTEISAAATVIDTETGEILALASHPGYDGNLFTNGIDHANWQRLLNDPHTPLVNKAIAGQYAPGSTFKMVVALAGLEDGVIDPNERIFCPGHLDFGNHRFHCWRRGGHGSLAMIESIAQSCDVYFYELARRIGMDRISHFANRLGLGINLPLDMPGQRAGLVPTRAWKEATRGESWLQGETLIAGIGQGYVLSTPLQLAVMTARLANGGREVTPHLTLRVGGPDAPLVDPPAEPLGFAEENMAVVREAMIAVTSGRTGTARGSQIDEPGFEMAGKTGTSQVRRITVAERAAGITRNQDLPWARRDHALFVGYAPIAAPRYACSVVVEHGGGGSAVAAPIASDILRETQRRAPARPLIQASDLADGLEGQDG